MNYQVDMIELSKEQVNEAISNGMKFSLDINDIKGCNIYIVTVPTPIDKNKRPDLTPLIKASETVGKDDIVIYESTVYPGATEEDCVPVLEKFLIKISFVDIVLKESIQEIKNILLQRF